MMEQSSPFLIAVGSSAAFVAFWLFVVWLVAQISGWRKLAEVYPARLPFNETCWPLQSARLRWAGYNGILKVCADAQALHFSVLFFFRPGNPPFSIPWEEITVHKRTFGVELRCHRAESVPIFISPRLVGRLEPIAAGQWQDARS